MAPRQHVSRLDPVQGVNRRSRPGRITVTGIYARAKTAKIAKRLRGSKGGVKIPTCLPVGKPGGYPELTTFYLDASTSICRRVKLGSIP